MRWYHYVAYFFRRRIPCERAAPPRQWCFGTRLPESFCTPTWGGPVVGDGQCAVGPFQSYRRIPAGMSCGQLQSEEDAARAGARGGHLDPVVNACPDFRTVTRRAVSLWFSTHKFPEYAPSS